ncbi:MAG: sel1 repeat family protein [Alphaproteobacteria bacterium]|nr:sel1 repeat family protein [Alphaproteobacteria bacterium]
MKNIILALCMCFIAFSSVRAEDVDLLSDEMLLGTETAPSDSAKNSVEEGASDEEKKETDESEKTESFFGFIIKPITNLFASDEKITDIPEGEKESPLDKSIRLANEGSKDDQMNLAYMYLYGTNGVSPDFAKSFKYYEMAAKQNDPIALNNLGSLYFSGIGTKKNNNLALLCFTKASDLGNDNASLNLAFIYLTGGAKDAARNKKSFELFEKSQKAGNKIAEFMLGYAYYKGFVVEPNYKEAYKLIKDAANGKSQIDEAQLVLAELYTQGIGTVQNYTNAVRAYRAAANQGNIEATMKLAEIYAEGKLTPKNLELSHALYNIAASQSVPEAAEKRDALNEEMQLEALTNAQTIAQNFKSNPSELTNYVRQTYGYNIRDYINNNMVDSNKKK